MRMTTPHACTQQPKGSLPLTCAARTMLPMMAANSTNVQSRPPAASACSPPLHAGKDEEEEEEEDNDEEEEDPRLSTPPPRRAGPDALLASSTCAQISHTSQACKTCERE
jgi:hypothetical protein